MATHEIGDFALLSDCTSAALVTKDGSVDWMCWPHFGSPSVFGRMLDPGAGHWSITPTAPFTSSRKYRTDSLVLVTTLTTESGTIELTDALALGHGERGHQMGLRSPHHLLRHVECTQGSVEVDIELAPRPEYGIVTPLLNVRDGILVSTGGPDRLQVVSSISLDVDGGRAAARLTLTAGQSASFAMAWSDTTSEEPQPPVAQDVARLIADTVEAWQSWSAQHQRYEGPWSGEVHQAGIVLRGLTFVRTGAIVAAATTSLPEVDGGERNWDYRYSWVRDASLTLEALWVSACPDEAQEFFSFLSAAASADLRAKKPLQIMYGVDGTHDLSERELPHLRGWRDSTPVRVGNGAWTQAQSDVYGEMMAAAHRLREQLTPLTETSRLFLIDVARAAIAVWQQPDQGIWEVRGEPRHFTHSKLMCWVALDRAVELADMFGDVSEEADGWRATRDEMAAAILSQAFDDELGAFTQSFGSKHLDASTLLISIYGLLPGDDPRVVSTIAAIEARLTDERGYVYRYRSDDGLAGEEGAFVICTFWLAHAHALAGNVDRANEVFALAAAGSNDLGLMAEMVDPSTGQALGNFPQAFSHVGLVLAAWAIAQASS